MITASGPRWPTILLLMVALLGPAATRGDESPIALAPVAVYAEGFRDLRGIAVDARGHVFVADRAAGTVTEFAPDGTRSVVARRLERPIGLALDASGRLLIAEERGARVVRVEADGRRTPVVAGIKEPRWLAIAEDGTLYISARRLARDPDAEAEDESATGDVILRLSPAGLLSVFAAGFEKLQGLAVDQEAVYAATHGWRDDAEVEGVVVRIPILNGGWAGPAVAYGPSEQFEKPRGLARDRLGALYLTTKELELGDDESKRAIAKLHGDGSATLFAARLEDPQGLAFDAAGNLFLADGDSGRVLKFRAPPAPLLRVLATTNLALLSVRGSTKPGALVDLIVNEAATPVTVLADRAGAFVTTLGLALNANNHLEVYATPHGGRGLSSPPALATVTHDAIAPTLVFQAPPAGGHLRPPVAVRAQAADTGSGVAALVLSLDGQPLGAALTPSPPAASVTASAVWGPALIADGVHALAATATDQAGNTAAISRAVIVDTTPPDTHITAGPEETTSATAVTLMVTGTDNLTPPAYLLFAWRLDGGSYSAFSPETRIALSSLQPGPHTIEVTARDLAGNDDLTPAHHTFTVRLGLTLAITTPTPGATVPAGSLLVRGNVEAGGAEVSVAVNGVPAAVHATTFAAVVPVASNTTALTAVATTASGTTASHSVAVIVSLAATPVMALLASPRSGVAPLTVRLSLPPGLPPSTIVLDFDGNGTPDFFGRGLGGQFTYIQPGLYFPRVTITDIQQGTQSTAIAVVKVEDPHVVTLRFQSLWNGFKARLVAGDTPGALSYLSPTIQSQFGRVFQALGSTLPTIGASLEDLVVVEQSDDLAEAAIVRQEGGVPFLYFIYFRRDSLGRWLIEEM